MLGIRIVLRHHDLLRQLLMRNLAARYKGSALGLIWSFAHPLMMLGVYTFVFGIVFKARWGQPGRLSTDHVLRDGCIQCVF